MKIINYRRNGRSGYGLVVGDAVVDGSARLGEQYPDLREILTVDGRRALSSLETKASADFPLSEVELLSLMDERSKALAVGRNYGEHIKEGGRDAPEKPMLFPRFPSSLVSHGQPLVRPRLSDKFDYEGELAVIIGTAGRHIPAREALSYIAGYTCFNDGSVRDWQRHTAQLLPGKNFWRSGSIGPWLVTADEIADPHALQLRTRVNGAEVQACSTGEMIFSIPNLIEYISAFIDLQPGDIIATGTPSGVGLYREPQLFLKAGDILEVEIAGIGTLSNPVVDE